MSLRKKNRRKFGKITEIEEGKFTKPFTMFISQVKKYSTRTFGREKEKNTKRNCRKRNMFQTGLT
jgi:hypothetical protein